MEYKEFKELVVARAERLGIDQYELYYQSGEAVVVNVFGHAVDQFSAAKDGGVCFRCIVNGKMGYAATEALNEAQAISIVDRAVDNASVLEAEEPVFLTPGGLEYQDPQQDRYPLPEADALITAALDAQEQLYKAHPAVVDGSRTRAVAESSRIAICNSLGLDLSYENDLAALMSIAVVARDGEKANDVQFCLGALDQMDVETLTRQAAETAYGKLGGEVAPTGNYPVVLDPEAVMGLLSVFNSVFSAEAAQKGLSRLSGKEGEVIAAPAVTLTDDPFCKDCPEPMPFDAEGSPTFRKNVIEGGVLKTLLHNRKTANIAGTVTTGNASKAGYDAPIGLRPFTMYLAPGHYTRQQLLQKAGNGVYIRTLDGLHAGANPVTGDFSLQSAGFMIENGELTVPVKSFTVAGNFYTLLKNITALSDTVVLPRALGATSFGGPCVLVEGLSIAGK